MDQINEIVALNLKRLREERKLSLDQVAKTTGVSKSMLSQIERGVVVPTISTIWKITNGLKVSFTEIVQQPEEDVTLLHISELDALLGDNGKYRNYPIFKFGDKWKFEMYYIELDSGAKLISEAHPQGSEEFLMVFSGDLCVRVGETEYTVPSGSAIRFHADCPHAYTCIGDALCQVSMVVAYE